VIIIKEDKKNSAKIAAKFLARGEIISFAADTVYGLAVDASNCNAVEQLYKIKKRDLKKPIAIFVKDLAMAKKLFYFDEVAEKIAKNFSNSSLTLVLKKHSECSSFLAKNLNSNDDDFLGFRIIQNNFIKNLLIEFNGIIAVTSANPSNENAATSAKNVETYFSNSNLSLLIDGGFCKEKIASTVVKIVNKKINILRQGTLIIDNS
jgi:L-threonylcarbamoyladenylate synthase